MAPMRREAPLRWKVLSRWAGERPADPGPDPQVRLADLPVARQRTVAVLGHERTGIPAEAVDLLDVAVEIRWWVREPA